MYSSYNNRVIWLSLVQETQLFHMMLANQSRGTKMVKIRNLISFYIVYNKAQLCLSYYLHPNLLKKDFVFFLEALFQKIALRF